MNRESDAKAEFKSMFEERKWNYRERDVPANQLFHNLQLLIRERMRGWEHKSFEEKIRIEMELATYKENLRLWAKANGVKLPNLDRVDVSDLNRFESLHQREVLVGHIADTERWVRMLTIGKEQCKILFEAYEELLFYDPRVNPTIRDELLASLKPMVYQEVMKAIANAGGPDSSDTVNYLLDEARKMEQTIQPVLDSNTEGKQGKYTTALVPVNRSLIELYARSYHALEIIFKALHWRLREEQRALTRLKAALQEHGGPLSPKESQCIETFTSGRNPDYNIGRHLADLDIARIEGEKYLRGSKGR